MGFYHFKAGKIDIIVLNFDNSIQLLSSLITQVFQQDRVPPVDAQTGASLPCQISGAHGETNACVDATIPCVWWINRILLENMALGHETRCTWCNVSD